MPGHGERAKQDRYELRLAELLQGARPWAGEPTTVDVSADLHGHILDFIRDGDRRHFERHPDQDTFIRPAFEHEFCDPRLLPERCVDLTAAERPAPPPGYRWRLLVEVERSLPGVRFKHPFDVLEYDDEGEAT